MLSEPTRRNLSDAFQRAVRVSLPRSPSDVCLIEARVPMPDAAPARQLLITISSFAFRIAIAFEIGRERQTLDYYTAGTQSTLDEVFSEVVNLCCGAFSRELSGKFAYLAMSIPHQLESRQSDMLKTLAPSFHAGFDITLNGAARIRITICMSCRRPVEFDPVVSVSHAGGELELF